MNAGRHPPGLHSPSAHEEPRVCARRDSHPAAVRPRRFARPRRFPPRDTARVCLTPVTLLGFSSSGPCSARWSAPLVGARALLPLSAHPRRREADGHLDRLQSFAPTEHPCRPGPKPRSVVALMTSAPLGLSPPPVWNRLVHPLRLRGADTFPRPLLPCPFASRRELRSINHRRHWLSSLRRRRPFWGLPPRLERTLSNPLEFR